jgi:hypothetical protein
VPCHEESANSTSIFRCPVHAGLVLDCEQHCSGDCPIARSKTHPDSLYPGRRGKTKLRSFTFRAFRMEKNDASDLLILDMLILNV